MKLSSLASILTPETLSDAHLILLTADWALKCLSHQAPPPGDDWDIWLLLGGRGCGKTRAGAEWVRKRVHTGAAKRIALVAPTYNDAREVMLEGESGLLNIGIPSERPAYIASRRRLEWKNGAVGQIFSAEDPDGLRGPQFDCAWADEFCAWSYPENTLSNLRLCLRLGETPQIMMTTTPKPIEALRALMAAPGVVVTRAQTADNRANLAPGFIRAMEAAYGGSRIGRQELRGELLLDTPGALWTRAQMDAVQIETIPPLSRIIVAVDPPVTSGPKADACGIIVAGLTQDNRRAVILHDATVQGETPRGWAKAVIKACEGWEADYILAEVNQGGEMVQTILASEDAGVPVRSVRAHVSKARRAQPVAVLYEQGRVKHAGRFAMLEDELCRLGADEASGKSPDRADALVWAITDLLLSRRGNPAVRQI